MYLSFLLKGVFSKLLSSYKLIMHRNNGITQRYILNIPVIKAIVSNRIIKKIINNLLNTEQFLVC
jgi:hypothetical protein